MVGLKRPLVLPDSVPRGVALLAPLSTAALWRCHYGMDSVQIDSIF